MKKFLVISLVTLLAVSFTSAQDLGFKAVGGGVGFGMISFNAGTSTESLSGFAISGHAYLGDLTKNLGLYPELQYLMTSKDISGATWKANDFAINVNVLYAIEMEGAVKPYAGAGLGLNMLSTEVAIPGVFVPGYGTIGGGTASGSDTKIGINLIVGARYQLNPGLTLFFEPRYALVSDANQLVIKVGATYSLK